MTENILWNGNNCSYYVLVLTNVFIDCLFFVHSLCISLQQISLNRVFALYVSYIILATLSSINFKCSFHDKVSSNRMPSNSNMSFFTWLFLKYFGIVSCKSSDLLVLWKFENYFRSHLQRHLVWDSGISFFSWTPSPLLLSGLSKKVFKSLILQYSISKVFERQIPFKANSRCSLSIVFELNELFNNKE